MLYPILFVHNPEIAKFISLDATKKISVQIYLPLLLATIGEIRFSFSSERGETECKRI